MSRRIASITLDLPALFSPTSTVTSDRRGNSVDGKASPQLYAQMVSEDRQLSLSGYDVYRFGGHELDGKNGPRIVAGFFRELFQRYDILLPPSVTN
ncbi:hypothetical protein ACW69C_33065 [Streptomyces sp. MN3]